MKKNLENLEEMMQIKYDVYYNVLLPNHQLDEYEHDGHMTFNNGTTNDISLMLPLIIKLKIVNAIHNKKTNIAKKIIDKHFYGILANNFNQCYVFNVINHNSKLVKWFIRTNKCMDYVCELNNFICRLNIAKLFLQYYPQTNISFSDDYVFRNVVNFVFLLKKSKWML